MTPKDMLAAVGHALYGDRWQMPLADDLEINRDTVRRWVSGHTLLRTDHGVFRDLLTIIDMRIANLKEARQRLARWLSNK